MRVLLVPFAAAALFATATYGSASMTDGTTAWVAANAVTTGANDQPLVDLNVPALKPGVKIQVSWLDPHGMDVPRQVTVTE